MLGQVHAHIRVHQAHWAALDACMVTGFAGNAGHNGAMERSSHRWHRSHWPKVDTHQRHRFLVLVSRESRLESGPSLPPPTCNLLYPHVTLVFIFLFAVATSGLLSELASCAAHSSPRPPSTSSVLSPSSVRPSHRFALGLDPRLRFGMDTLGSSWSFAPWFVRSPAFFLHWNHRYPFTPK